MRTLALAALFLGVVILAAASAPSFAQNNAVKFDGTDDYIALGPSYTYLGVQNFTVECWFYRRGAGATANTGTGGVVAVPLVTKGRNQADGGQMDCNYFLGIRGTDSVLVADFEDRPAGVNHPVAGATVIRSGRWYHAAATYDGQTWRLYLNGNLETTLNLGSAYTPQYQSRQHAAIAAALDTNGTRNGAFNGIIDEARVWNRVRTQQAIIDSMGVEITSAPGLRGRWGLNEGSGTVANNSVTGSPNGTLTNGPTWTTGTPFALASSLKFGASSAYATFGNPPELGLRRFTVETLFRRDGAGTAITTGTGGVTAIPLVTHGAAESEVDSINMNWFLGIRSSDNVLCADFEDTLGGTNHPIAGTTAITNGTWYYGAVTYDGTTLRLYLNGGLESEIVVGVNPTSYTHQRAGLATSLKSDSTANGFFNGALDEVRVWNYARTASEIATNVNSQIASPRSGLVARWGLNEGAGSVFRSTAGTSLPGRIKGTGWSWDATAPFNIIVVSHTPPEAPTGLSSLAISHAQIDLSWTDNSWNETGFEIEQSVSGSGGPFAPLATVPAGTQTYTSDNLNGDHEYCYQVRAVNGFGSSDWTTVSCATTPAEAPRALDFGSSTAYVTFGRASALDLQQFTLETWFRRDGVGTTANTGNGGVIAIPLITKGEQQTDGDRRDMNYFLGIRGTDSVLVADLEATPGGQNYPVIGVTPVHTGEWHHVAVTYNGSKWSLYLDGQVETELVVNAMPQWQSWQHAGLGAAMDTAGTPAGHFDGVLDEARIWNYARTQTEIQATINTQIASAQAGLVARWALNEDAGTIIHGSAGTAVTGILKNTGYSWTGPAPFNAWVPVAVTVQSFAGALEDGAAVLRWTTSFEQSIDGFNLLRSEYEGMGYAPVNAALISSKGPRGGAYEFSDATIALNRTYYYQIEEVSERGSKIVSGPYALSARAPFQLSQNSPNPFNPTTTIKFTIPKDDNVKLVVYDASGRRIRTLVDQPLRANFYKVSWDGRNDAGRMVSSGVYLYRLQAGHNVQAKKMLLLR